MISISDAIPVQFWLNGVESFNIKDEPGIEHQCFFQLFNADDEIRIQLTDDTLLEYKLEVQDDDGVVLVTLDFDEVDTGVYEVILIPEDESILNEFIKLVIKSGSGDLDDWTIGAFASDRNWNSICYGNGLFVAVASSGTTTRVMTSPDGITWTLRNASVDRSWSCVTYGNGLFVAASSDGDGNTNNIMTSPDGITWTTRDSGEDAVYRGIVYGNGKFIVVSTDVFVSSTDGITWTPIATTYSFDWESIVYGGGLFVAVSSNGSPNQVMTSTDGVTWSDRNVPQNNQWRSVAYGAGLFVAVSSNGTNRVMTSPDGITWTVRTAAAALQWREVVFANGLFVAVANSGTGNRSMISQDGITWTTLNSAADNNWESLAFGADVFVAVSNSGTGDRIMTTAALFEDVAYSDYLSIKVSHARTKLIQYSNETDYAGIIYDTSPVPDFMIRVEAKFYKRRRPEENESEELSDGSVVKLLGTVKKQKLLQVMQAPPYFHDKLTYILQHNTIYIDNLAWVKEENYETEELDEKNPFETGKAFLTQKNNSYVTNPFS